MGRGDVMLHRVLLLSILFILLLGSCLRVTQDKEKKEAFKEEVVKTILSKYPEIKIEKKDGIGNLTITAKNKVESIELDLTDLYLTCNREPEKKNEKIREFLEKKLAPIALVTITSFDEIKDLILPKVLSKNWFFTLKDLKNCPEEQLPYEEPLSDKIVVTYVVDYPDRIEYINRKNLKDWNVSGKSLRQTAIMNLIKKTERLEPQIMEIPEGKVVIYNSKDGYDSARILLGDKIKGINSEKNMIIGIPHRDYLVIVQGTQKKLIQAINKIVREEFDSNPNRISCELYTIREQTLIKYPVLYH